MIGPERLYGRLVSGDPATIDRVHAATGNAAARLTTSIDSIVLASKVEWRSLFGARAFNLRAWATKASAEMARHRLQRVGLVVRSAQSSYLAMKENADAQIAWWREQAPRAQDVAALVLVRAQALAALRTSQRDYGEALSAAVAYLTAAELTPAQEEWLLNGLVRSALFDLTHPSDVGTVIPFTLATGSDEGHAPQGLGYSPETGLLVQASYRDDEHASVSITDPATGEQVATVRLGAHESGGESRDAPVRAYPDHVGGVAIDGDDVWITSTSPAQVFHYSLADLRSAPVNTEVAPVGPPSDLVPGASSYATMHDGYLYTGDFYESRMYKYRREGGEWTRVGAPISTPERTQGVVVRDDEIVFSTSHGRTLDSQLRSYDRRLLESGADPVTTTRT